MRKVVIFPVDLLLTSDGKAYDNELIAQIKALSKANWFVAVSNRPEPKWFSKVGLGALFVCARPRESGKFVAELLAANAEKHKLQKSQVVILGYGDSDVPMFANSKSVLIRCGWRPDISEKIQKYGIPCPKISALPAILKLLNEEHPWFFTQLHSVFDTYCLTNAGTKYATDVEFIALADRLRNCLKHGTTDLHQEFLTHALSSLYATEVFAEAAVWAYYPSSSSKNKGEEIIAEFTELPRTTFRVHRKPHPLFIRHKPTSARHTGSQEGRGDPATQIRSIHLHEDYRDAINGKTVVVLDDFMNYGVSFCVAAAFLRKAGAKKVLSVAMGKFPRKFDLLDIEIATTPFAPVDKYLVIKTVPQFGTTAPEASEAFKRKFV